MAGNEAPGREIGTSQSSCCLPGSVLAGSWSRESGVGAEDHTQTLEQGCGHQPLGQMSYSGYILNDANRVTMDMERVDGGCSLV